MSAFWAHAIANEGDGDAGGIHLLWMPPPHAGYSVDGFDVWRRERRPRPRYRCYDLTPGDLDALRRLLRIDTPVARIALRLGACPGPPPTVPNEPHESRPAPALEALTRDRRALAARALLSARVVRDPTAHALGRALAAASDRGERPAPINDAPSVTEPQIPPLYPGKRPSCLVYELRFERPCASVRIRLDPRGGLAAAFREHKAVDAQAMEQAGDQAEVEFTREGIDRVLIWLTVAAQAVRICCAQHPQERAGGWDRATPVAKRLQLPLRAVEPSVATLSDERALAESRLLPHEALGAGQFKELSQTLNDVLQLAGASPLHASLMTRSSAAQDFIEIQPWLAGLALGLDPQWRRMLGFGIVDPGRDLVPGSTYDYRIVGRFRRRDVEERLLGFHSVPLGTPLPAVVHLGGVRLEFAGARDVVAHPEVAGRGLRHGFRKGVRLDGTTTLGFPTPIDRLVFELERDTVAFDYRALSDEVVASGALPNEPRAELRFPEPITRLVLEGSGLLYGLRLQIVPAGTDPDEVIEQEAIVPGIRYERTDPPDPPPVLGTVNLQEPRTLNHVGFKLNWLPPPARSSWPPGWWAPDVPTAPPTEVTGFELERRRVDTNGRWQPFEVDSETGLATLVGADRSARADPGVLRPGDDLLDVYPEVASPAAPVPALAQVEDVLRARPDAAGPPLGSLHKYRIRSVDAIGRRSATATDGSVVRLEKRQPPPRPPGVRARLLQAVEQDLSDEDRARLAGRDSAVLIEWTWTEDERRADPQAREFRLYWQPLPPDLILGEFTGDATWTGAAHELAATLSHAVTDDQFAGELVRAGRHRFRVAGHDAGDAGAAVRFRLEPSALGIAPPPMPGRGRFQLTPSLTGEELRPAAWAERAAVVAIDDSAAYEYVFPQPVTLDAHHPRARVWVGVSAADDQDYIADELPAAAANGGRPGNESAIVPSVADGRYLGRPPFEAPPPAPDVPEVVLPEVGGDAVRHKLDLPALLPDLAPPGELRFRMERLSGADLLATMSASADDTVEVALPDGDRAEYAPGDVGVLLDQIRSGEPARIENRFLMDVAIRFADTALDRLWQPAPGQPVGYEMVTDEVPNQAGRYLYRLRGVDAAGHRSEGVAFVPRVFRVPSRRLPGVPRFERLDAIDGGVEAVVSAGVRFDVAGLLLFWLVEDRSAARPEALARPDLLRLPGRPDLHPRLRLADGALLEPSFAATGAAAAGNAWTWTLERTAEPGKRILAWAAVVTRDGVPSLPAGPAVATTGDAS